MTKIYQQTNVLKHVGVLGMHWGVHKSIGLIDARPRVKSFMDSRKAKSVSDLDSEIKKPDLGERLAKAYNIKTKNGKIKSIGLDTVPKIMASAMVAHFAVSAVSDLARIGMSNVKTGHIPQWVGDIAWTTGKVLSNTPLK